MPERDWGRYVAIGLSLAGLLVFLVITFAYPYALGSLSGYREAETRHYQTEYADRTAERIEGCQANTVPALLVECVEEAIRANHEHQRNEGDLQAQGYMADWAFWALVVATCSFLVTSIGTAFLAWQVKLTREAVEDTETATKAMVRQNELAERAQRPWLNFDIESVVGVDFDGYFLKVAISAFNQSDFPAHDIRTAAHGTFFRDALLRAVDPPLLKPSVERLLEKRTKGGAAFPRGTFSDIAYAIIEVPDNLTDMETPIAQLMIGISYLFDGGRGFTFKEYLVSGVTQVVNAAKAPPQPDSYGEVVMPKTFIELLTASVTAT